ncbi:MAG TPA: UDP-N-acetylmuramoyl-L-alanyl-D-glutamate--2,6-diaminopimelate ligase [Desulfatiglandales bacterium]|nr:UDP-N-acetylmuramoyl-L-alanyl-D-glutamate--2,6-diaminopimelate ligase [Desulfatiglandales bacterium]
MRLDYLLNGQRILEHRGETDIEISGLTTDSRKVKDGYLFIALKGSNENGHRYLADAVQKGARALVVQDAETGLSGATVVRLPDTRGALFDLADRFYNYPARHMDLIGITGTNGKTTTSYFLESILREAGKEVGVIGTINYRFKGNSFEASLTTPDPVDLMRLMREMRDAGVTHVIVEVSSHSLDQGRTQGLTWSRAIFTSFSRDHLDYHSSMEEYFRAKSLLFDSLEEGQGSGQVRAIINMDDPKGQVLERMTKVPVVSYGLENRCRVRAADIESTIHGLRFRLVTSGGEAVVNSPLLGRINVYNMLAAAATGLTYGIELKTIVKGIQSLSSVPGRLDRVQNKRGLSILVDYAHTPDALEKALQTVRELTGGRLITVFGCGGDRDRGKRPEMGRVAGNYSDLVIITSDNPRGEDPGHIVSEIEPGVRESGLDAVDPDSPYTNRGYQIIIDRKKAIRSAIDMADKGGIVLIAGKGHENYQIIGKRKRYFNDAEEAALAAS